MLCQCGKNVCEVEQHANRSPSGRLMYSMRVLFSPLLCFFTWCRLTRLVFVCVFVTQELMSRTSLETQKLDLMDEVSFLKLKLVGMDETSSNAQTQDAASKEQNKAEVRDSWLAWSLPVLKLQLGDTLAFMNSFKTHELQDYTVRNSTDSSCSNHEKKRKYWTFKPLVSFEPCKNSSMTLCENILHSLWLICLTFLSARRAHGN